MGISIARLLIFVLTLFTGMDSFSADSGSTGGFSSIYTDIFLPGSPTLSLIRVYNSKSTFSGMFGSGWGTVFETSLVLDKKGQVSISEYGVWAPKVYSFRGPADPFYFSSSSEDGKVQNTDNQWVRYKTDGSKEYFDENGRMIRVVQPADNRTVFNIEYNEMNRIKRVSDNTGRRLDFIYNSDDLVIRVKGIPNGVATYRYNSSGMLYASTDADGRSYTYKYDNHDVGSAGIVTVVNPDGSKREIDYYDDENEGNVRRIREPDGRVFNYSYSKDANGKDVVSIRIENPPGNDLVETGITAFTAGNETVALQDGQSDNLPAVPADQSKKQPSGKKSKKNQVTSKRQNKTVVETPVKTGLSSLFDSMGVSEGFSLKWMLLLPFIITLAFLILRGMFKTLPWARILGGRKDD